MRILQITPYYHPHIGGIERYVANLCKYLVKNGHDVTIYTSNIPQTQKIEIDDGFTIKRFTSIATLMRNPIVPAFFFPNFEEIKKFDIIQVHMLYSTAAVYGYLIKRKTGKSVIFTHHGRMIFGEKHRDFIVKIYEKTLFKLLIKSADYIIVLSKSDADFISHFNINMKKIVIIPNGINIDNFKNIQPIDESNFRFKYKIEQKFPLLYVGEVSARKGLPYLINAMDILINQKKIEDIKLLIIGNGDYFDKIKDLIRYKRLDDNIGLLNRVPLDELITAFRTSKILVLPSLSEGMPTVILEAMYFGLPVIATDIPGIRDYFVNKSLLIPPRDEQSLAKAILRLYQDYHLAKELSNAGKELVINNFSWEKVGKEYENKIMNI